MKKAILLIVSLFNLVGCGEQQATQHHQENGTVYTLDKEFEDLKEEVVPDWTKEFSLSELDELGRPHKAEAIITYKTLRKSEGRPSITVDPVGFNNEKMVLDDGKENYVYDRSHLIAYTLFNTDLTETRENLITGTRTLNRKYMTQVESAVRDYANMGLSVYYSVEPLYRGEDLVPYAVHMKVVTEDKSLQINRIIYNKEKGITIDYQTGYLSQGNINLPKIDETTMLLLEENKDFSFPSCKVAKENGYRKIKRGEYGYGEHLDKDGDGLACE